MIKEERLQRILEIIMKDGYATAVDLARAFGVSEITVRRDLSELSDRGFVQRAHGGALMITLVSPEPPIIQRLLREKECKEAIAGAAAALIQEGDSIERWDELHANPDWHFYGKDYPHFIEPIEAQLRVVARHPKTNFISAHVLSYAENLHWVAAALDKHPNLYVDIGERIGELGRQPYSARKFITAYADRVLFGTDIPPNRSTYGIYFRCLETMDEYFDYGRIQGRYRIYGVYLPDDVLQKVYYQNACKLVPGLKVG